ncbi:MAG: RidA family protein [Eubacteriaceae bacterium]|nr:RidA family protein [Eubacteriaceae bacterium]
MKKKQIITSDAPGAIGPYSQGIAAGDLIFVSGQIPADPSDGSFPEGIEKQTERALLNVKAVLESAGSGLSGVVKTTVLLKNMDDFAAMNSVYETFFGEPCPARAAYEVVRLPKDAMVEIEAIAVKTKKNRKEDKKKK